MGVISLNENVALRKYEKLSSKERIILYFFIYSFFGWCLETIYAFMVFGHFVKRGFLYGPICPIYGFGAVLLIINLEKIKGNNFVKFLVAMIIFSLFEFLASWILETLFNQRWWDYSDQFMNLQGRICIIFSLLWGTIGVLFSNTIHPFIDKQIKKILYAKPIKFQKIILYNIIFIFMIDELFSIISYI